MVRWVCLVVLVLVALVLGGCAATPESAAPETASALSSAGPSTGSPAPSQASPAPSQASSSPTPLDSLLPRELGGVELHTFPVGQDILQRLANFLGTDGDRLEVRFASEHGARFFQMYAIRVPGQSGAQLAEAWADVAYPPDTTDVAVSQEEVGGRAVGVIHSPHTSPRLGTFYTYADEDTLFIVQAFDPAVAADALSAIP